MQQPYDAFVQDLHLAVAQLHNGLALRDVEHLQRAANDNLES